MIFNDFIKKMAENRQNLGDLVITPPTSPPTLCWQCKNSTNENLCPWVKNFTPVRGWDAEKGINEGTFHVKHCPLYDPDPQNPKKVKELSEWSGIDEATLKRRWVYFGDAYEILKPLMRARDQNDYRKNQDKLAEVLVDTIRIEEEWRRDFKKR